MVIFGLDDHGCAATSPVAARGQEQGYDDSIKQDPSHLGSKGG